MSIRSSILALECFTLFVILPIIYALFLTRVPIIPLLWLLTAGCLVWLLRCPHFDRRGFFHTPRPLFWVTVSLTVFLPAAALLTWVVWRLDPKSLFFLPRTRPVLWILIMLLYPILSVYPQAIVYRAFFFTRYAPLFPRPWLLLLAATLAFSLCHIVFRNPVAPALTFLGGLFFSYVYHRTRSLLLSSLPHALLGCTIFTVGLGPYFLGGTLRLTQSLHP